MFVLRCLDSTRRLCERLSLKVCLHYSGAVCVSAGKVCGDKDCYQRHKEASADTCTICSVALLGPYYPVEHKGRDAKVCTENKACYAEWQVLLKHLTCRPCFNLAYNLFKRSRFIPKRNRKRIVYQDRLETGIRKIEDGACCFLRSGMRPTSVSFASQPSWRATTQVSTLSNPPWLSIFLPYCVAVWTATSCQDRLRTHPQGRFN